MKRYSLPRLGDLLLMITVAAPMLTLGQVEEIFYQRPSYWRPYDKTGINVFETTKKTDPIPFEGLRVRFGAGFTQQFQNLKHENPGALYREANNQLYPLASGFMTSQANLNMDVQLADGIRLNLTTYLSARRHNESWVKGGYIQFDKLPFKGAFWNNLMELATIKVGHMEINYGDAHFRRSDGGQTLYNPFMESYILDAFTTEIGGEFYLQKNGLFGMAGVTSGMLKGNVDSVSATPQDPNIKRSPSVYVKAGIDKQLSSKLRVRLSASYYHNSSSAASGLTLYSGDRTGSNYQNVIETWKDAAGIVKAYTAMPTSGRLNPGFTKKVDAAMLNGFLKAGGLELFGTYETAMGRTKTETSNRKFQQYAVDVLYRFGQSENLFTGVRYNSVKGQFSNMANDIRVDRVALAGGWFLTRNILLKGEYVLQEYKYFPSSDYRSLGKFKGYVIEAVVGF